MLLIAGREYPQLKKKKITFRPQHRLVYKHQLLNSKTEPPHGFYTESPPTPKDPSDISVFSESLTHLLVYFYSLHSNKGIPHTEQSRFTWELGSKVTGKIMTKIILKNLLAYKIQYTWICVYKPIPQEVQCSNMQGIIKYTGKLTVFWL